MNMEEQEWIRSEEGSNPMMSIGIDLGMSNTVVAKVNDEGEVSIHQFEGSDLLPSIIHVEGKFGYRIVGRRARDLWTDPDVDPSETFRRWKASMATSAVLATQDWGDGPRDITPEQLTTWLVEYIMNSITQDLGGETVDSVTVTVPHDWRREHVEKCLATREAVCAAQADGRPRERRGDYHPLGKKATVRTVDEPVAAAAYALHASGDAAAFADKNMLIVDIGEGVTDLSLVRVGAPGEPLTVIDAVNNNVGGDYATALLLGKHLESIGSQIGIDVPLTPEAVLAELEGAEKGWLREAFAEAETELLHRLSTRLEMLEGLEDFTEKITGRWGRRQFSMSSTVDGDPVVTFMSCSEYLTLLEPFFESTRGLLTRFLSRGAGSDRLPHAILMTGGGSRIGGLRSQVIEPAIRELAGPTEATEILGRLDRLRFNDSKLSTAVAMGAALVAAGRISIEERLLWDVGLEIAAQLRVIRRLRENHSVCTDALHRFAVAGPESLPAYESAQEPLFDDAVDAAERSAQRLRRLQRRLEDLDLILEDAQIPGLDLEAKIAELEERVAAFQADDVEGKRSELLALRKEEIRLRRAADELDAERIRLVEEERRAAAERDRARNDVERLEDAVGQKRKDVEELKERRVRTEEQLTGAERLLAELRELSRTPASVEAERLLCSIRALARGLPADEADKKFESLK